jgi:inhibitor of cysteine peptidase
MEPSQEPAVNLIPEVPPSKHNLKLKMISALILLAVVLLGVGFIYKYPEKYQRFINLFYKVKISENINNFKASPLKKFSSESEYRNYMTTAASQMTSLFGLTQDVVTSPSVARDMAPLAAGKAGLGQENAVPANRVSETNNQVAGIDEPDIVKTDGKDIYISNLYPVFYAKPMLDSSVSSGVTKMITPYPANTAKTKVISALPIESITKKAEIEKSGNLFLNGGVLSVLTNNEITAYNVSDPSNPKEIWKHSFDDRQSIISSRLQDNYLYVATRFINSGDSCVIPLTIDNQPISINCTEIYYPSRSVPVDSVFNILKIDLKSGKVEKVNSFVGSSGLSVFYMSKDNLYLTYTYFDDMVSFLYQFYTTTGKGLVPDDILQRIKTVDTLDISVQAKLTELTLILQKYQQSLNKDDLLKIETETQDKLTTFLKENVRNFEHTGIIKLSSDSLETVSSGLIPGKPLNQFSLDEYQENLRVATTVGEGATSDYSINDVYVLDKNLNLIGSVKDMGEGEKIYSVRFIDDRGYVVTFKQTDPFYVLDLKDAKNPSKVGELKIPGYSSYLHKLDDSRILGVGQDGQKVKLSIFNVSDPKNPLEEDKYTLDEYWSDILNNHHAFLQDAQNKIIFIPGGKGGYVFSYMDKLSLVKAVSGQGIKRALYINNNLYLVGDTGLTVLNEDSWQVVKKIDF